MMWPLKIENKTARQGIVFGFTIVTLLALLVWTLFSFPGSRKTEKIHKLMVVEAGYNDKTQQGNIRLYSQEYNLFYEGVESRCEVKDPVTHNAGGSGPCPLPKLGEILAVFKDDDNAPYNPYFVFDEFYKEEIDDPERVVVVRYTVVPEARP